MGLKKNVFYWAHGIVAMLGSFLCGALIYGLVSGADRGHPPAIIFLPVVIIAWLILHIFLIFIKCLVARGNKNVFNQCDANNSWPPSLIVVVMVCSICFLQGLVGLVSMWLSGRLPIYTTQWLFVLLTVASFICLCGILLRKYWGRLLAGVGCIVIAGFFTFMAIRNIILGYGYDLGDGVYLLLIVSGLGGFGYHILTSKRVKKHFINN